MPPVTNNPFAGGSQLVAPDGIKLPVAPVQVPSGPIALSDRGFFFPLSGANGAFSHNLPNPALVTGQPLLYKKIDASVNPVTLIPFGSETIDGGSSTVLSKFNQTVVLVSDGVNWNIFTNYLNPGAQPSGSGTAGVIPLWTSSGVLGNSSISQDVNGNVFIGALGPQILNVLTQIQAKQILIQGTDVGATLQSIQTSIADLQRKFRLLLKAMFLNGATSGAIAGISPALMSAEVPLALSTN